jgi:hypothetical protein
MSDKKQTAVEWFWIYLEDNISKKYFDLFQQAKEMEKQQIIDAFWNGDNTDSISEQDSKEFAKKYFKETYGGQNND